MLLLRWISSFKEQSAEAHFGPEWRETGTANSIKCYSCEEIVSSKRELTDHRRKEHYQQKLCRFYHGNGAGCRFPDSCIDIHGSRQQQRQSVIQENSQYRKKIPCRDGITCDWAKSAEGCRYFHTNNRGQEVPAVSNDQPSATTTAVSNDQLKELIALVQAGLNLKEQTRPAPILNSLVDFPGLGYTKNKSV